MQHSCSHYNAFRNIPWQTRTYLRTWQHQMTTMKQPFQCNLQPEIQEPHRTTHTDTTTRCKTHRRNNSRTKRPQPHPPHTRGTFHRRLQPLYTEKHKVSCSGFLPKTQPMQHSCSHSNAICNHNVPTSLPQETHRTSLRHHFPSSPLPFVTTSLRHHFPSSPLPFLTTSLRHHFPSSPLPFVTTPLLNHFPSSPLPFPSPLPFVTTSLRHHSPSSSLPFFTTSLPHHSPSSSLPFSITHPVSQLLLLLSCTSLMLSTTSLLHSLSLLHVLPFVTTHPSSSLPFFTTSLRHHFPSSSPPFINTSLRHHSPSLSV